MIDKLIGRKLSNYRIERLIGKGGMAHVYYGTDIKLNRPVAIKILDARYRDDVSYARRFVHEASAVSTWRHENIIQVYYADDDDSLYYFAMEYINGLDLAEILSQYAEERELMPHEDVIKIAKAVASALDYAHSRGLIHRDVKPGNVLVSRDNRVVLSDFGLAMDTGQGSLGQIFGTPHYIAPEQAKRSADATPLSDLYSFGIVLYEMLTGEVPFDDVTPTNLALQHITQPPPNPRSINPNLTAETEKILLKALSKAPENRYQSAKELADALEKALKRKPRVKPRELPPPPAQIPVLSQKTVAQRVAAVDQNTLVRAIGQTTLPNQPNQTKQIIPKTRRSPLSELLWALLGSFSMLGAAALLLWGLSNNTKETDISAASTQQTAVENNHATLRLLYNTENLHLQNLWERALEVGRLDFEMLREDGTAISEFPGAEWSKSSVMLDSRACMSLEFYIDEFPPEPCEGREAYISVSRDSYYVFWLTSRGAAEFRVLWDGSEVARCPATNQISQYEECEVFLP